MHASERATCEPQANLFRKFAHDALRQPVKIRKAQPVDERWVTSLAWILLVEVLVSGIRRKNRITHKASVGCKSPWRVLKRVIFAELK